MRALSLLVGLSLFCATASAADRSVEDQIKKLEQDWAQAAVKGSMTAVDQFMADDFIATDPGGRVTDKEQNRKALVSGDLKFQSQELSDLRVRVYGNTAVATGTMTAKGSYKGQEFGGNYRFTDTWVRRKGKWEVVAEQNTKVEP